MISMRASYALMVCLIGSISACTDPSNVATHGVARSKSVVLLLQPAWRGSAANAASLAEVIATFAKEGLGPSDLRVQPMAVDLHDSPREEVRADLLRTIALDSPQLVLTETMGAARMAQEAGVRVPVIFSGTADAVRLCLAESLRRPGGNVTGSTSHMSREAKLVEILKDAYPGIRHVRVMAHGFVTARVPDCTLDQEAALQARAEQERGCVAEVSASPRSRVRFILESAAYADAAHKLGMTIDFASVCDVRGFAHAVRQPSVGSGLGVVIADHLLMQSEMAAVTDAVVLANTPAIFDGRGYVEKGAVLGVSVVSGHAAMQGAVEIAALVLRGVSPGEIPIDAPGGIDIVVNLQLAARHPALRPSFGVLTRADEFIRSGSPP